MSLSLSTKTQSIIKTLTCASIQRHQSNSPNKRERKSTERLFTKTTVTHKHNARPPQETDKTDNQSPKTAHKKERKNVVAAGEPVSKWAFWTTRWLVDWLIPESAQRELQRWRTHWSRGWGYISLLSFSFSSDACCLGRVQFSRRDLAWWEEHTHTYKVSCLCTNSVLKIKKFFSFVVQEKSQAYLSKKDSRVNLTTVCSLCFTFLASWWKLDPSQPCYQTLDTQTQTHRHKTHRLDHFICSLQQWPWLLGESVCVRTPTSVSYTYKTVFIHVHIVCFSFVVIQFISSAWVFCIDLYHMIQKEKEAYQSEHTKT